MQTPTLDHHQDHPEPGCGCHPQKLCSSCMGKLQRMRTEWALKEWLCKWDNPPPRAPTPRARPLLRLVLGGR